MKRPFLRFAISILFSVTFSLLGAALATAAIEFIVGDLPTAAFIVAGFLAIFLSSAYSAMLAQNKFNGSAIILGTVFGSAVALLTAEPAVIPYSLIPALLVAANMSFFATVIFRKPRTSLWYGPLITNIHILQSAIIIAAVVYSLFHPWMRPLVALIGLSGFIIWNRRLMDGCPLTTLEDEIYKARGRHSRYGDDGFMAYYMNKLSRQNISKASYKKAIQYIAVAYFLFFLAGMMYRF